MPSHSAGVDIGFEQSAYTFNEYDGTVEVCATTPAAYDFIVTINIMVEDAEVSSATGNHNGSEHIVLIPCICVIHPLLISLKMQKIVFIKQSCLCILCVRNNNFNSLSHTQLEKTTLPRHSLCHC